MTNYKHNAVNAASCIAVILLLSMHLNTYCVSAGQIVSAGQQIGTVGSTGVSTGDHLHFGIALNGVYVNPCQYVALS